MFITEGCTHYRHVQRINNIKTRLAAAYTGGISDRADENVRVLMILMFLVRGKSTCCVRLCMLGF
jgi:hypothetical protein